MEFGKICVTTGISGFLRPLIRYFDQIITFKLFRLVRCGDTNAQVPEPEAGVI